MKKADNLAAYLVKTVPCLIQDPERLFIGADTGQLAAVNGYLSHTWSTVYDVTVTDCTDADLQILGVCLLRWAKRYQPNLLVAPDAPNAFTFNVVNLDRKVFDVDFKITLSDLVSVVPAANKVDFNVLPREEPDPVPGFAHLDGFKPDATLLRLYVGDDLVAEIDAP